jgi:hypothetical protein
MTDKKDRPASGREPIISTSIALPRDLHEQLKREARRRDMTVSSVIRTTMRQSLAASGAPEDSED